MGIARPDSSFNHPNRQNGSLEAQWAFKIALLGLLFILLATLYPFNFSYQGEGVFKAAKDSLRVHSGPKDIVVNILLFMPLGFGGLGLLTKSRLAVVFKLAIVLLVSLTLSGTVELLQNFLPQRSTTFFDILTNTSGGVLGGLCFYWRGEALLKAAFVLARKGKRVLSRLPLQLWVVAFLGYMLLSFGAMLTQQGGTFDTWSNSLPLYLGNPQTGRNAWEGQIAEFQILDRGITEQDARRIFASGLPSSLAESSLVAAYDLKNPTRGASYPEQAGRLPELAWRGQGSSTGSNDSFAVSQGGNGGVLLGMNRWLKSTAPVTPLLQRLQNTAEFTFMATVQPAKTDRVQYARFFAIASERVDQLNFMLGQANTDLICWLKTTLAEEPRIPVAIFRDIFTDLQPQRLVLTYSDSVLRFYSDRRSGRISENLIPGGQRAVALGMVFVPLAVLLGLTAILLKQRRRLHLLLLYTAAVLPPFVLEHLLALHSHRDVDQSNVLLGLAIMLSPLLLLQDFFRLRWRSHR